MKLCSRTLKRDLCESRLANATFSCALHNDAGYGRKNAVLISIFRKDTVFDFIPCFCRSMVECESSG
jgi:hypothetical protein